MMPLMAPLAPTAGMALRGEKKTCASPAATPVHR